MMNIFAKLDWNYLVDFERGQGGRMLSTALVILVAWVLWNLIKRRIARKLEAEGGSEVRRMRKLRERFSLLRNGVVTATTFSIIAIWGSTIGGFAISVAAVAGGLLVVAKEFLSNLLGFAMFSMTRPFRLGDHIEIDGTEGRVIDIGIMSFEMMQFDGGHHAMGGVVSIPNGLILLRPIYNRSGTGEFSVRVIEVQINDVDRLLQAKSELLNAALSVCEPWLDEANDKLQQVAQREMMEFGDAKPRVLLHLADAMGAKLSLCFPCKGHEQTQVEQAILTQYLERMGCLQSNPSPNFNAGPDTRVATKKS